MMHAVVAVLLVIAVIAFTAMAFVTWVVVSVVRLIVRAVSPARAPSGRGADEGAAAEGLRCPRLVCRAPNPPDARFCRRCGHPMPVAVSAHLRRVRSREVAVDPADVAMRMAS